MRRILIVLVFLSLGSIGLFLTISAEEPNPSPRIAEGHTKSVPVRPLKVFSSKGGNRGFVIYFSDRQGWDTRADRTAAAIASHGIAVAAVDSNAFLAAVDKGKDKCVHPVQPLMVLAQNTQHQMGWTQYRKPILMGNGLGGTLAYASLAQAVPGIFTAGISEDYGGFLPGTKQWCSLNGYSATKVDKPVAGWRPGPATTLPTPWREVDLDQDRASGDLAAILSASPRTGRLTVSNEANGLLAALTPFLERPADGPLSDLPLAVTPTSASSGSPYFAVLYSGDGGWAGLDKAMAAQFAARGIPVVGFDCLSYFWQARTPEGSAKDLERVLVHYGTLWHRKRAIVIGYSYGADVMPFIVRQLSPSARTGLSRVVLLGLSDKADFQFHLGSWLDISSDNAMPTVPQIDALRGLPLQCIRGLDESGSACSQIASGVAEQVALPGGHHFNGDARLLVASMVGGLKA